MDKIDSTKTIDVDGVLRHRFNSNNMPIHPTDEGIRNFWRWFGSSKAVDESGRPLVLYHGTTQKFNEFSIDKLGSNTEWDNSRMGFFFLGNKDLVVDFANKMNAGGDVVVKEVYLSMQKSIDITIPSIFIKKEQAPVIVEIFGEEFPREDPYSEDEALAFIDDAIDLGTLHEAYEALNNEFAKEILLKHNYDSMLSNFGNNNTEYVVFNPGQIKSARYNSGAFNPNDNNIHDADGLILDDELSDRIETEASPGMS